MYKNRKPIIIGILCVLVVVMAIGFALLREQLTITGSSHIDSNWNIRITNIRVKELNSAYPSGDNASSDVSGSTGCTTNTTPCNSTEANFEASLKTPGDYITYEVTITNSGSLDGVVQNINLECSENDAITCTKTGLDKATTIAKNGGTNTVDVKVEYNSATSTQPSNTSVTAQLSINYQQDLGQMQPTYPTYNIGDDVSFGGTNWKVIKASTAKEDYVTLMKETDLTAEEIGNAYSFKRSFEIDPEPYMFYYWDDGCHSNGTLGTDTYNSRAYNCSGHNDYAGSKVRGAVEGYMMNFLDESKLKEINNYKIRLITVEELETNLGFVSNKATTTTPSWVYSGFGEDTSNSSYCTMTPATSADSIVAVNKNGKIWSGYIDESYCGVRPVINLLKTAVQE